MLRFISKLQNMSEEARKAGALFGAFFITLFIFLAWFAGLRANFISGTETQASVAVSQSDEFAPFASLKRSFGELIKGITSGPQKSSGAAGENSH